MGESTFPQIVQGQAVWDRLEAEGGLRQEDIRMLRNCRNFVFIAGVGFVVTHGTGGVGLIPYVSGLAASIGAAIVLDEQVQHKIAIGDYSGAVDQATYHLPGIGSGRSTVEALIEGNTLGAMLSLGSVGLDVMPFIEIGKLPGSKADALGLANKTGSGAPQQKLAATTNGKSNGNHGQQSNPNKKNPAERPKGGKDKNQPNTQGQKEQVRQFKKKKPNISGKEGAKDVPDWVLIEGWRPYVGESGKEFATRVMDAKYGPGNYNPREELEFSQIKKWADRSYK